MLKNLKPKHQFKIEGSIVRVRIVDSILTFSSIHHVKKLWLQIFWIVFFGILSAIFGVLIVENTGLYDIGLSAFSQGIGRIAFYFIYEKTQNEPLAYGVFNGLFWGLYLIFNIPLVIFGWFKIGKRFTLLSILYICVSTFGGLIFAFIHNINKLYLLGDLSLNKVPYLADHNVQLVFWNYKFDAQKHFSVFIYGILWGLFQAVVYAVLLIIDCSTGGLDFPAVWYGESSYKDIGIGLAVINIISLIISYIIGSFIPASFALIKIQNNPAYLSVIELETKNGLVLTLARLNTNPWSVNLFFSPNFLSSLLMNLLLSLLLNVLFPKTQMVKVEIYSAKADAICDVLISENKPYSLSINYVKGGYSKNIQKILIINCVFMEAAKLLQLVRNHDENALFVMSLLKKIDGYIFMPKKNHLFKKSRH